MCKKTIGYNKMGYKINFETNMLYMNFKFAKAAGEYGTPEYNLYVSIHKDFPAMKDVKEAGRNYSKARPNKNLTYAHIENYISAFDNADELLAMFEIVKAKSKPLASPYKYVADWFRGQSRQLAIVSSDKDLGTAYVAKVFEAPSISNYLTKKELKAQRAMEAAGRGEQIVETALEPENLRNVENF